MATQRSGDLRTLTVIDDGVGIPLNMQERIFEPRVTSKLDTAHMDKWGMHGRGMALYSIVVNARRAEVVLSGEGRGTSISVELDANSLGERKDQSTFPHFEASGDTLSMRGPKNLLRTAAEFSLEHKQLEVFLGSPAEVAATLYAMGASVLSPTERAFRASFENATLYKLLAYASDPAELETLCNSIGLSISERTARRIMDGNIIPLDSILERIESEALPQAFNRPSHVSKRAPKGKPHISAEDIQELSRAIEDAFIPIVDKYYLEGVGCAQIKVKNDSISVNIPFQAR